MSLIFKWKNLKISFAFVNHDKTFLIPMELEIFKKLIQGKILKMKGN
jgi:hypothetical protein